jgi:hypothetical protein
MLRALLLVVCACNVMGFAPIHGFVPQKASRYACGLPRPVGLVAVDEIEDTALRLCCSALWRENVKQRKQVIHPLSWKESLASFALTIGPSICRNIAAAPALRMSTDGLISRRSFGGVAAAGLAALVVPKPSNAIEYKGARNDGKWAVHEGAFKDEEFKGFVTDPEVKAQWIPSLDLAGFFGAQDTRCRE